MSKSMQWLAMAALAVAIIASGCSTTATSLQHAAKKNGNSVPRSSSPPCKSSLLFAAAETGQHFSTDRSKYPPQPGQGPGAYDPVCSDGWAIALVSHPDVGTTDGGVLFRAEGGGWVYVAGVGGVPADCILVHLGVPASVAEVLWPPAHSAGAGYCNQNG
jgi:hypothetical protein